MVECVRIKVCGGKQTKENYIGICLTDDHENCILYKTHVSNPEKNPCEWRKELGK